MKTLKKTLAALNNVELYARESYSRPKTTTAINQTPQFQAMTEENTDGDNVYIVPFTTNKSEALTQMGGWRQNAYYADFDTVIIKFGSKTFEVSTDLDLEISNLIKL